MSSKVQTENSFLEKTFKLKEHNTNVKTEVLAGITTFMTMAYILVVNPDILSATGMDFNALFTATALSAAIATIAMAFLANYPFALAPGMGLNAFFAFTVVLGMGYSWEFALTAILIEGIIFLLLTFFNVREALVNSIPINIKHAVSVGIGLFIALIGFKNAKIVVAYDATLVALGDLGSPGVLLALAGLIITGILLAKKVKGALLIGIVATTAIGIPLGITPIPSQIISAPPSLAPIFFKFDFSNIFSLDMIIVVFTFLFVDLFDTLGTLVGVASKADMLDKDGKLPKAKQALFADAIGTTIGACLGTSTVTTYVESASGVAEGGRTGLTALTSGALFALSLFLAPLFLIVPSEATAPVLILVGLFMMSPINKIDLNDFTEAIPAFLTIVMMPFTFSIAEGIVFGIMSYVFLKLCTGKGRDVSMIMYALAVIFILKHVVEKFL
ncbi:NCS2 family permease [Alkaliphilus peptidifermentans]|uniref:Putative MFS transporter, AGZA family, xanthine/uracil permease n=1 Tax=Alkaliphilus peptidifermentans DSM 18978 TaxID=1120976 RepID=A0A1G5KVY2_9FIRM|nr:NCS2 family permease [Alkaliphilus peptidifermentans]SCZ04747.1 putative MFS transporter, AGZA family, xanthine/uracil permease [Alkaliphilus peptidifermentans DSM 18978]